MSVQELDVEVAAGGLLWRDARAREKLAVVHRERHEDWSLPKGKFDPDKDEKWVETAIREVREETECKFHVDEFADCISYLVDDTPKVVLFWNMDLDEEPEDFEEPSEADPKDEVDKRRWMSVPEAMEYLDYPDQRTLVARAASRPLLVKCRGDPVRTHGWRRLFSWSLWPRSASHGRLVSVLKPYRAELSHLTARVERTRGYKDSEELPWAEAACSLLEEARVALDENDTDRAWRCFLGANRLELFGLDELGQEDGRDQGDEWEGDTGDEQNRDPLHTRARTIAREADEKLDSWRKTVVEDALGMRGELKEEVTVEEVYEAALVLHGHFHNQYHKIGMLKRQSSILAVIAFLTTIVILVINGFAGIFASDNITGPWFVLSIALFGVIGASVSGFLSLAKAGTKGRIPDQIVNSWVTFARPTIGAAAALVLFGVLVSDPLELFTSDPLASGELEPGLALVVASAAGSSERLLDRAVRTVEG